VPFEDSLAQLVLLVPLVVDLERLLGLDVLLFGVGRLVVGMELAGRGLLGYQRAVCVLLRERAWRPVIGLSRIGRIGFGTS
jgi:hypothetical protein